MNLIQFPWRFGALQAFSSCVAVACAFECRASRTAQAGDRAGAWAAAMSAIGLIVAIGAALQLSAKIMQAQPYEVDIETVQSPLYLTRPVYDYMPRSVKIWKEFGRMPYPDATRRAGLTGPGRVEVLRWGTHTRLLRVVTLVANRLRIRTFDYPGWQAGLDGTPVQISSDNAYGAIEVEVPAGAHEVEVRFTSTGVRRAAGLASGLGCMVLILVLVAAPRHWLSSPRRRDPDNHFD